MFVVLKVCEVGCHVNCWCMDEGRRGEKPCRLRDGRVNPRGVNHAIYKSISEWFVFLVISFRTEFLDLPFIKKITLSRLCCIDITSTKM